MAQASNPESGRQPHEENETPEVADEHAHPLQEDSEAISIEQSAEKDGEDTPEAEGDDAAEADVADPVVALKAQVQEMKDQALRAMAETENVRRRAQRDVEEAGKYAVSGFARDMITVSENLFLALANIPAEAREEDPVLKALADGVDMTLRELLNMFEKHGIMRINPQGEKFNHNFHQAISQVEDPAQEPGTVLQVVQAGYVMHDRLLRPAMVVVAKRGNGAQKVDTQV